VAESLFSPLWYRVADQHPQLRTDVRIQRQHYRDQLWYLLVSATDGRQVRINAEAYQFIGRCDGQHSVQQVWDALLEQFRDDAPTQDEVVRILGQLDEQGLVAYDNTTDAGTLARRRDERARQGRGFVNPFALRIRLGDPSRLLERLGRLPMFVFNVWSLWIWIAVVIAASVAAASDWAALSLHARTYMGTPRYLILAWVCFPFIKALHELAHALAIRRWGGQVHETGFSLFVLVPAPYVDASAANAFRARYQRAMVGLAGIMAEFALAAVALLVWFNVQPGLVRDAALVIMFVASVSTLLFNGNPLLSFDAYYVLCDAVDLPNLASRSRTWWAGALRRVLLGRDTLASLQPASGERKWLIVYAPLSLMYRLFISALLVFWLGAYSFLLGSVAAVFLFALLIVKPLWSSGRRLFASARNGERRGRATVVAFGVTVAVLVALCTVPLPYHTVASAVVWLPEQARIRPAVDGFITGLAARDGEHVTAGQELVALEDPALNAERAKLASQLERLQAGRFDALPKDRGQARNAEEEIQRVQGELTRIDEKISHLMLRAQVDGTLVMPRQQDLPGTFVHQGATIGYVLESADIGVRAAVPEYDATLVREHTRTVDVRTAEDGGNPVTAHLVRDIPAATFELPSAALGDRGGGPHATDPSDKEGVRTIAPVVLVDLKLPARNLQRVGGRAWVRFDHGPEPLARRWYRRLRQLLLQHFNPVS
jgi:putative peptide zinc metalloprotease protein